MRVSQAHPFQIVGIDYTGTLYATNKEILIKVYACPFTCAVSRAIHLELVNGNSAEEFLRAFRRFVGRRGIPQYIYSDNSTTFTSSSEILKKIFNHHSVKQYFASNKTTWRYIPKRSPWMGGYWERLIGMTKSALKKSIGRNIVSEDELRTLLVEVESILNDRPLIYAGGNLDENLALTPNQLIFGRRLDSPVIHPILDNDEDFFIEIYINKRQKKCAKIIQAFWKRWRMEYLTQLRDLHQRRTGSISVKVGDVVNIHDDTPRITWRLGIVEALHCGNDGQIRSVDLRTSTGKTSRPVSKLYPLEIHSENTDDGRGNNAEDSVSNDPVRPQRIAAKEALNLMKSQMAFLNE